MAFVAARSVDTDKEFIDREVIRFDTGSSTLPLAEAQQIDQLSYIIGRVFRARPASSITVTGHTDEVGTADMNMKLSHDRAQAVIDSLIGPDLPESRFHAVGMADEAPLRKGGTDWDRASNRSVSFKVNEDLK